MTGVKQGGLPACPIGCDVEQGPGTFRWLVFRLEGYWAGKTAALLVSQDPKTVISVLMKLSGGSPLLAPLLNVDAFLAQARAYEEIGRTDFGKMLTVSQTEQLSHPVPVLRAKEIDLWAQTANYQCLLNNPTMRYDSQAINKGDWRNW